VKYQLRHSNSTISIRPPAIDPFGEAKLARFGTKALLLRWSAPQTIYGFALMASVFLIAPLI
jgi:hypothetical protein